MQEKQQVTLTEELSLLDLKTLGEILEKLDGTYNTLKTAEEKANNKINYQKNNELLRVQSGERRKFFTSEYLTKSNVEFVSLLNKHYYSMRDKVNEKALKFRNNEKNIEKYQLNHKKPHMRREKEYIELAYPNLNGDLWEVELEIKLVKKAIKFNTEK